VLLLLTLPLRILQVDELILISFMKRAKSHCRMRIGCISPLSCLGPACSQCIQDTEHVKSIPTMRSSGMCYCVHI
jgi:hypothetical protein